MKHSSPTEPDARTAIRERALILGFDAVGFTRPDRVRAAAAELAEYLRRGYHGDMAWLARGAQRGAPDRLWPEARSVVMLGLNYSPEGDPMAALAESDRGAISVYAQGRDYHKVLKRGLKALGGWMHRDLGAEVKVFVDTGPVMEKPLAAAAGLGWQGKHTNLVSRELGSWLFLGALFTTLDIAGDGAHADLCGTCSACLDACPTAAFPAPYRLDARRCISYLTIEHKGHIAAEFRRPMGNRIFGCDDCLAVCPWNKYARTATEPDLAPRADLGGTRLADLARLDDAAFRRLFAGTAVKRTGRDRFVRNVLIALGNARDRAAVPIIAERLDDASPLVRAMAVWALGEICSDAEMARYRGRCMVHESDAAVRAEWAALEGAA